MNETKTELTHYEDSKYGVSGYSETFKKQHFDIVEPQIIANQKKISESLFKYLQKDKKSDW